jgi:uncharacterized protein YjiS (DUF1127 family)
VYILIDEMTNFFQRMFDKTRYVHRTAYELSRLTDKELEELQMTRMDIPYVSHMSALKNDALKKD